MKLCSKCQQLKEDDEYYTRSSGGKKYLMSLCKSCEVIRTTQRRSDASSDYTIRYKDYRATSITKTRAKHKYERANGINREKFIFEDSRNSDKKKGLSNDLTKKDIATLIADGCSYCGEHDLMMTLDRIDNSKGHLLNNVSAACIRCNLTRGSMPHAAWLIVATAMRKAKDEGLFGDWSGRNWSG